MPIYEYRCTSCGAVTEVFQRSMTDKPLKKCPKCSGEVEKQISRSSFHLEGSGWYVTDYARKDAGGQGSKGKSRESGAGEGKAAEGATGEAASSQGASSGAAGESKSSKKTGSGTGKKD